MNINAPDFKSIEHVFIYLGKALNIQNWKSKPADPLREKVMQIKDKMDKAFNSVEYLLEHRTKGDKP